MTNQKSIPYFDRATATMKSETVYAAPFLFWAYNTRLGRALTHSFFRQKYFSKFYGWWSKQGWSRRRIRPFVDQMKVNMAESRRSLEEFRSFNDFFTREIDVTKRNVRLNPNSCVAPADGKVLAYPVVESGSTFRIKRHVFNLERFLGNDLLSSQYAGGSMVISRLCLADYHHFHFPDSGIPGESAEIRGKYYAGAPYALKTLVPFYTENFRVRTLFASDHFGKIAIIEVGAFTVGSIRQVFQPGIRVAQGEHKGYFELGGSTVVLLFEKGKIVLDEDLCENTKHDVETYVRFGESIGKR